MRGGGKALALFGVALFFSEQFFSLSLISLAWLG